MKVEIIPCHFDNFSYLLVCEETGKAAIIDPAEYYPVAKVIRNLGVELTAIYCTHHHADHIGGLDEFCEEYPDIEVAAYGSEQKRIPKMTRGLEGGEIVRFGKVEGEVLHTPGHTAGCICFRFGQHLFTGDTLFGAGCGRLFEGTPEQMYNSLSLLVDKHTDDVKVYFGHEYTVSNLKFAQFVEPDNHEVTTRLHEAMAYLGSGGMTTPSSIGLERQTNPFLRSRVESVCKRIAKKLLIEDGNPVTVFAAIRRLKDSY